MGTLDAQTPYSGRREAAPDNRILISTHMQTCVSVCVHMQGHTHVHTYTNK